MSVSAISGKPAEVPAARAVSDTTILRTYQFKDEFFRPQVVMAQVATVDARMRSTRATVIKPNVNGFEMRAIRDILRNHGYVVEAPERGFYHVIDQLTVSKPS